MKVHRRGGGREGWEREREGQVVCRGRERVEGGRGAERRRERRGKEGGERKGGREEGRGEGGREGGRKRNEGHG